MWKTISFLSKDAQHTDIVFYLYLENTVKYGERNHHQRTTAIDVIIEKDNQPLPVTMDSFWASSTNKENLKIFFINWLLKFYKDDRPDYLGGSVPGDITCCIQIIGGISSNCLDLKCDHEEADEQILYHINHAILYESYTKVVMAATDTDIFISLLYHYQQWVYEDLQEIWMLHSQGVSSRALSIPKIAETLESDVISVLPAVHALSGCDSTSKIGSKKTALKVLEGGLVESLLEFGRQPLSENHVSNAENFLVKCYNQKANAKTFDDLRYKEYHSKAFNFDLEKLLPTSNSIYKHIQHAYYQCFMWVNTASNESMYLDPLCYGYTLDDNERLVADICSLELPDNFPLPCTCGTCA